MCACDRCVLAVKLSLLTLDPTLIKCVVKLTFPKRTLVLPQIISVALSGTLDVMV